MKTSALSLAAALLATTAGAANAASIGLSTNYSLEFTKSAFIAEGGAITYNWEDQSLLIIGDEAEYITYRIADGALIGGSSTSFLKDPEGVSYMGGNKFVVAQERTMRMSQVNSIAGSLDFPAVVPSYCVAGCGNVGNSGLEGISYDRRTGDFYGVKESGPQAVYRMTGVDFAGNGATAMLFDASLLGLRTLSDISVLSNSDAFFGTDMDDNLLILSASSNILLEVSKAGEILSSYDLSGTGIGTIEGVTVDDLGNIWLVGEEGPLDPDSGRTTSGLIKLQRSVAAPAVPEPATWAMMLGGLGLVGGAMRRRKTSVAFA